MKKYILILLFIYIWKGLLGINPSNKVSIELFINDDTTVLVVNVINKSSQPLWLKDFYYFIDNVTIEKRTFFSGKNYKKRLEKICSNKYPDKEYPDLANYGIYNMHYWENSPQETIDSIVTILYNKIKNDYPDYEDIFKSSMTDDHSNILRSHSIEEAIQGYIKSYLIGQSLFLLPREKVTQTYIIHPIKEKRGEYTIYLNYEYKENIQLYGFKEAPFDLNPIKQIGDYILIDEDVHSNVIELEIK